MKEQILDIVENKVLSDVIFLENFVTHLNNFTVDINKLNIKIKNRQSPLHFFQFQKKLQINSSCRNLTFLF